MLERADDDHRLSCASGLSFERFTHLDEQSLGSAARLLHD